MSFSVLIVDDEPAYGRTLARALRRNGIDADVVHDGTSCLAKARSGAYEVVLLDNRLPDARGLELIPALGGLLPGCSIFLMTAYGTFPEAVQAIRMGAEDFLDKSTSTRPIVDKVIEAREHKVTLAAHRRSGTARAHELLGESPGIRKVVARLEEVATSPGTSVLILGESGSGKEVAARQLHHLSGKPWESFVAVDCLSLPVGLAESHLFGHEKGSFTGAHQEHAGFFETAGEGTVFLDEIGDMDLALQGRLLRALEARTYRRVGSNSELRLRARVVTATNRDLARRVGEGKFRMDLFHRLSVFPIELPPLRDRGDDVLILAEHFISLHAPLLGKQGLVLDDGASEALLAYGFPGNVRELKNVIERAIIVTRGTRITTADLPERLLAGGRGVDDGLQDAAARPRVHFVPGIDTMASVEKKMIVRALEMAGGVKSRAARLLGISRYQLLRRLERYAIEAGDPSTRGDELD
jgi:two-component system response regulator HydG